MPRLRPLPYLGLAGLVISGGHTPPAAADLQVQLGPRPYFLLQQMPDSQLKRRLAACSEGPFRSTLFSIGHRGAPLQFPEHARQSYLAAARMGAGILECDVTFTADLHLVCRHAQNDLHATTDILSSRLANSCTRRFTPAGDGHKADAECRTSDLDVAEFLSLNGKMAGVDRQAKDLTSYLRGTPDWRTGLYAGSATLMTHAQSIALFRALGAKFMPELKAPLVNMPFNGFRRTDFAQKLIDDYKQAGIPPADVWPQSFDLADILYWIENEPEFARQAVYLDDSYTIDGWNPMDPATWRHSLRELKALGINILAPPIWTLLTLKDGRIVPSLYGLEARRAGLQLLTWTLERSGPLKNGGGWYYQSIADAIHDDGKVFEVLHVLAKDVGVIGVFSDWPATVSYYASCMNLD